jgi:hypothetical protein
VNHVTDLTDEQLQQRYVPAAFLPADRRARQRLAARNAQVTAELRRRGYVPVGV